MILIWTKLDRVKSVILIQMTRHILCKIVPGTSYFLIWLGSSLKLLSKKLSSTSFVLFWARNSFIYKEYFWKFWLILNLFLSYKLRYNINSSMFIHYFLFFHLTLLSLYINVSFQVIYLVGIFYWMQSANEVLYSSVIKQKFTQILNNL